MKTVPNIGSEATMRNAIDHLVAIKRNDDDEISDMAAEILEAIRPDWTSGQCAEQMHKLAYLADKIDEARTYTAWTRLAQIDCAVGDYEISRDQAAGIRVRPIGRAS